MCAALALGFIGLCLYAGIQFPVSQMMDLFDNIWAWVILTDLYLGLFLFFLFIVAFEKRLLMRGLWLIALVFLGNLASLLFLMIHSRQIVMTLKGLSFKKDQQL